MKKSIILLFLFSILLGCASAPKITMQDLADYGIIVGRFPTLNHTLELQPLVPDRTPSLLSQANPESVSADANNKVSALKVKEGTYYLQGIKCRTGSALFGGEVLIVPVPQELRRPIVIKKGTVLYVGSFKYDMDKKKVSFSSDMDGVVDELSSRYPDLKGMTVISLFE
jgi:hypothetical protein